MVFLNIYNCTYKTPFANPVTYTFDNGEHRNEDGKVNYVADNKMPQQMAFHGVPCCLHRYQIVICLWYVRHSTNLPQA